MRQPQDSSIEAGKQHGTGEKSEGVHQAGGFCPVCKQGVLDYDSCLNLICPHCGTIQAGSFT